MKKASTRLLEQETQTPSPAPDLIPAESSTENLHWDWYSKRGHFSLGLPFSLAPGQSATFNVTFTPTTSDSVVGAISVTAIVPLSEDSNINPNSSLSVPFAGTGIKSA